MKKTLFTILSLTLVVGSLYAQPKAIDSIRTQLPPVVERHAHAKNKKTTPLLEDKESDIAVLQFDKNFKEKYKKDQNFDYEETKADDSIWQRFKNWLRDLISDFFSAFDVDYETQSRLTIFYRILSIFTVGILVFYIIRAFVQKDAYWLFKKRSKKVAIPVDDVEKNLTTVHFPTLLSKTINESQYRLAIRYYYLWLLQSLQESKQIEWHIEKTNSDYVAEIKDEKTRENFQYLSYIYNNIWYGEHEITETEFFQAKRSYETTLKTNVS